MPTLSTFEYATVRVVPRVERGEFLNVGVIVFCRTRRFLAARIAFDEQRLLAYAPYADLDLVGIRRHLALIPLLCQGGAEAGPIGRLPQAERFHWLVAPTSTMIQVSPVYAGLTADPSATIDHLLATLVHIETDSARSSGEN